MTDIELVLDIDRHILAGVFTQLIYLRHEQISVDTGETDLINGTLGTNAG